MAGLEALAAMIYHERQQEGSMLCAQHALNSLLQGNYFTAPDLASIARSFDVLEQDALDEETQRSSSHNMDDTGFFSVQVMDKALDVWGLHLVRWRSEQMHPFQDSPHKLLAFVLNLHQHWFTLRRFGPARTDIESDPGEGHWFNLNSAYVAPKWVSRTYLGMFLEQSEHEGYSVFAVVQADPTKPLALPRTEADHLAATVQAPDSLPGHSYSSSMPGAFPQDQGTGEVIIPDDEDYDINSEDVELQAALAASLAGTDQSFGQHAYVPRAPVPAPAMRPAPPPPAPLLEPDDDDDAMEIETTRTPGTEPADETDPVAASMARNRQMLERMKRMQEEALRETYEDEVASGRAQQRRRTREEEEQEELERAIAASVAEHNTRQREVITIDDDEEDEDRRPVEDVTTRRQPQTSQAPGVDHNINTAGVATSSGEIHRVYDDEDEQLQEALRASLQTMPEGYVHPPSPLRLQPSRLSAPEPSTSSSQLSIAGTPPGLPAVNESSKAKPEEGNEEANEEAEGEDEERMTSPPPPPSQVDIEEMRRRRLARFAADAGAGSSNDAEAQS